MMYDILEELKGKSDNISCIYREHPTKDNTWLLASDKPHAFVAMLKQYDGGFYQYANALINAIEGLESIKVDNTEGDEANV